MKLAAVDARLDAVRAMFLAPWLVWGRALMGRLLLGTVLVIIAAAGARAEPLPPGGGGGGFPDPASISYVIAPEAPTAADDIEISITPSSAQTYTGGVVLDIQDADFDFVFQGTKIVNSSPAIFSVGRLPAGDYSGMILFTEDEGLPSAQDFAFTVSSAGEVSSTVIMAEPTEIEIGQDVNFTVNVNTPNLPDGTVTLSIDGVVLDTVAVDQGQARFKTSFENSGSYRIAARYSGDGTYAPSKGALDLTVNGPRAETTVSISSDASPAEYGAPVTLTFTIASAEGTPEGKLDVSLDSNAYTTLDVVGGVAKLQLEDLDDGDHAIGAAYLGSATHRPSQAQTFTQTVSPAPLPKSTIVLTSSSNPAKAGEEITFSATVSGEEGTPFGQVWFYDGRDSLGFVTIEQGNTIAIRKQVLDPGEHEITATFFGGSFYQDSSDTLTQTVESAAAATTTFVTSSANPATLGDSLMFTVEVASDTGTPAGQVTLRIGDTEVPLTLIGGNATYTATIRRAGSYDVSASYAGSESHAQSSSTILTQQVNEPAAGPVATTTSVTSDANPASSTNTTNYTVTVTATEGIPTGNIVLHLGEEAYTITLNREGVATAYEVVASSKQVWAEYIGNDDFAGSKSTPFTQEAKVGVGLAIDAPSHVRVGDDINIAARVTSNNAATPTGEIVVMSGDAEWRGTLVNGEVVINIGGYGEATLHLYVKYVPDDPKIDEAMTDLRIEVESGNYGPYPTHAAIEQSTLVTTDVITQILSGFDTGEAVNVTLTSPFPFKQSSAYSAYMPDRIAFNSSLFAIQSAAGNKDSGPFNVWVSGKAGIVSSSGADGWFAGGLVGADYMFSPQLTGGLALMFDHTELVDSADTDIVSSGWMAIPYIKGKLSDTLSYQLQIGGGGSTSEITPDGAKYTDSVSAMRLLLSGSLSGSFDVGDFTFAPTASVTYFQQNIAAFTDGLGNDVPGMTAGNGSFSLSPALSRRFKLEDLTLTLGGSVQLSANLKNDDGVWSYDGLRDGAGLNLSLGLPGGATFRASTGVSGVVLGNSFSARGSVGLSAPIY